MDKKNINQVKDSVLVMRNDIKGSKDLQSILNELGCKYCDLNHEFYGFDFNLKKVTWLTSSCVKNRPIINASQMNEIQSAESVFMKNAYLSMKEFSEESFKKEYKTLLSVIYRSMEEYSSINK